MGKNNPGKVFSLGLQHVLAMYGGAIIVPLIVGGALKLNMEQMAYLVAIDLLMCGVATLLQVWKNKYFGIGLPVVLGCAFQSVAPMIAIGSSYGMSAIYGAIIGSGIFVLLISGGFGKLMRFFPPVVTGSVVTIIGITLIPVAFNNAAGGVGSPDFGNIENLILAFGVLAFIIVVNRYFEGFIQAVSVLLGMVFGTLAAYLMGKVDLSPIADASWFTIPHPLYFGTPTIEWGAVLTMCLVMIVTMVESTGVFLALGKICDRELNSSDLTRGYRAEGLAIILGGFFNAFPYTTFSQNVGLVQLSKVKTRDVIVVAGFILVILGFLPKFATLATLIPNPVLGGAMVAMFGMVAASGIKMLGAVDFSRNENLLVVACSVGMGLGVSVVPDFFAQLPSSIRILVDNGIVAGSLTAIILNIFLNMGASVKKNMVSDGKHVKVS